MFRLTSSTEYIDVTGVTPCIRQNSRNLLRGLREAENRTFESSETWMEEKLLRTQLLFVFFIFFISRSNGIANTRVPLRVCGQSVAVVGRESLYFGGVDA